MNDFRETMSSIANTVSILVLPIGEDSAEHFGVTISSLVSTSVQESSEEVLFVLKNGSAAEISMRIGTRFAINVLADTQSDVATLFSKSLSSGGREKLMLDLDTKDYSVPTLQECHARFYCVVVDIVRRENSTIYFADVETSEVNSKTRPLLYYRRKYCALEIN